MTVQFCGDCGARRPKPDQRFCIECGVPYDDVAPAQAATVAGPAAPPAVQPAAQAGPTSPPPASAPQMWTPPSGSSAPQGPAPEYAVPSTSRPGKGRGWLVGVAALVLAVGGAGVVGWQLLGPTGGAESPEAAAEQFLSAMADQDGVGMLAMVNPGEVAGLDDVYAAARDRLQEEGLVTGGAITDALDLELEGLEFDVDELGENVARVSVVNGKVTASYDPDGLPERLDFVADEFPDARSETIDIGEELREVRIEPGLTVIEVDGQWYVSLLGSVADLVHQQLDRYDGGLRDPDYDAVGEEAEPAVGATPEDVVENIVESVNDGDVESLVDQLPPDLALSLRPYAGTVERFLEDYAIGATITQNDLELEVEEIGDGLVRVNVEEAEFSAEGYAEDEYGAGDVSVYDACVVATDYEYGYEDGYCAPDALLEDLGVDRPYVVMREIDDGYQLDPIATVSSYAATIVESFPADVVDELLATIETGDGDFFECRYGDYCDD